MYFYIKQRGHIPKNEDSQENTEHGKVFRKRIDVAQILHFRPAEPNAAPPSQPSVAGPSAPQIARILKKGEANHTSQRYFWFWYIFGKKK